MRRFFAVILFACVGPGSALAQTEAIGQPGAKALRRQLEPALSLLSPVTFLGLRLEWQGALNVDPKPAEGYYVVSLPKLILRLPSGERLEAKGITVNMAPTRTAAAKAGQDVPAWDARVALPPRLPLLAGDGDRLAALTIGEQSLAVQWIPQSAAVTLLDLDWRTLLLERIKQRVVIGGVQLPERIEIGKLAWQRRLNPQGSGMWQGKESLTLDTLAVREGRVEPLFAVGGMAIMIDSEGIEIASESAGALSGLPQRFEAEARLRAVRVSPPDTVRVLSLPTMRYTLTGEGLHTDAADLRLDYRHEGAETRPAREPPDLTPTELRTVISAAAVPVTALSGISADYAEDLQRFEEATARRRAAEAGRAAMIEAGTQLVIEDLLAQTPTADFRANGLLAFDAASDKGYLAGANIEILQLDSVLDSVTGNPAYMMAYGPLVALLQTLGEKSQTQEGEPIVGFRFDIGPEGKLRVNGRDVSAFIKPLLGLEPVPQLRP